MNIFISFSNDKKELAEEIYYVLKGYGHEAFFDRDSLPPGDVYHACIRDEINKADIFVFLISSNAITQGSYALSELNLAKLKWPMPRNWVLPVEVEEVDVALLPPYIRQLVPLKPNGNIAADIGTEVSRLHEIHEPSQAFLALLIEEIVKLEAWLDYKFGYEAWRSVLVIFFAIPLLVVLAFEFYWSDISHSHINRSTILPTIKHMLLTVAMCAPVLPLYLYLLARKQSQARLVAETRPDQSRDKSAFDDDNLFIEPRPVPVLDKAFITAAFVISIMTCVYISVYEFKPEHRLHELPIPHYMRH